MYEALQQLHDPIITSHTTNYSTYGMWDLYNLLTTEINVLVEQTDQTSTFRYIRADSIPPQTPYLPERDHFQARENRFGDMLTLASHRAREAAVAQNPAPSQTPSEASSSDNTSAATTTLPP